MLHFTFRLIHPCHSSLFERDTPTHFPFISLLCGGLTLVVLRHNMRLPFQPLRNNTAGAFPAGAGPTGVYLVGNQIDKGRDPVTLSLSANGRDFDKHWSVRHGIAGKDIDHGGSCPRYAGHAKCCGYQCNDPNPDCSAKPRLRGLLLLLFLASLALPVIHH